MTNCFGENERAGYGVRMLLLCKEKSYIPRSKDSFCIASMLHIKGEKNDARNTGEKGAQIEYAQDSSESTIS